MRTSTFAVTLASLALVLAGCKDSDAAPQLTNFTASLSKAGEVPADSSTGTALATFSVVPGGILYRIDVLTPIDSITAAHIHGPAAPGTNAGVVVPLFTGPTTKAGYLGTLVAGVAPTPIGMTEDSLLTLLRDGNAYVNLHTRVHPAGEIRGQVVLQ